MPTSAYLPTFNRSPSIDTVSPVLDSNSQIQSTLYQNQSQALTNSLNTSIRDHSSDFNLDKHELLTLKEEDVHIAHNLRPSVQPSLEDLSAQAIVAIEALINASSLNWTNEASAISRRDSDIDGQLEQPETPNIEDEQLQLAIHRQSVHSKQAREIEIAIETVTDTIRQVLFSTGILSNNISMKTLPSSIISLKAIQRRLTAALSKCTLTSQATKSVLFFLPSNDVQDGTKTTLESMNEDVVDLQNILQDFIESALDVKDALPGRQILAVLGPRTEYDEIKYITTVKRRRELGKPTLLQLEQLGGDAREALRSLSRSLALIKQEEESVIGEDDEEEAQPDSDLEVDPEMSDTVRNKGNKNDKKGDENKNIVKTVNKLPSSLLPAIQGCMVTLTRFSNATEELDVLPVLDFDGLPPPQHPPDSPLLGQTPETPMLSANDSKYQELVSRAHVLLKEFEYAKMHLKSSSGNALVQLQDLISMNLSESEVCEALIGCILKDVYKIERSSSDVLESLLSLVEVADGQNQLASGDKLSSKAQIGKRALQINSIIERSNSISKLSEKPQESIVDDNDSDIIDPNAPRSAASVSAARSRSGSSAIHSNHDVNRNSMIRSQSAVVNPVTEVSSIDELYNQQKHQNKLQKLSSENISNEQQKQQYQRSPSDNYQYQLQFKEINSKPSQSSAASSEPWFLQSEYGTSLILQPNGSVKGGTVPALVERLTTHEHTDLKFSKTFLMTYTSFASSDEVFDLLLQRFHLYPPEIIDEDELTLWKEKKQMVVQLRVINVMKSWLEHHFDETKDDHVLERVKEFADSDIPMTIVGPVRYLKKIVERRESKGGLEPKRIITAQNFPPQPILPKSSKKMKLLDIDPLEMARQLTIIESNNFNRIKPDECLNKNWSGPEHLKARNATNIRTMIQMSNRLAAWVTHSVLSMGDDTKKRASVVKWFIYVAERCRSLNNFSTMAGIIAGINSPPIRRLKRTWDQVSQKALNIHQSLDTTIDSTKNFANYKQLLRNINPPCVPFLGVYLTYLTFINDGNPDFLKDAERNGQQLTSPPGGVAGSLPLVNFAKRQMAADLISEIQQYQATPYNLTPIQQISKPVLQQLEDSDNAPDAFPISLQLEPRERDDEKM